MIYPKNTNEDYLQQAVSDILPIIQEPPDTLLALSYGDATKNAIYKRSHILHKITTQPPLSILPLPPFLATVPILTPLSTPITHTSTPDTRV